MGMGMISVEIEMEMETNKVVAVGRDRDVCSQVRIGIYRMFFTIHSSSHRQSARAAQRYQQSIEDGVLQPLTETNPVNRSQ